MTNASFDGTLHLPSLNLQLPIQQSHYRWQQHQDHRGRPRSKVRFGSLQIEVLATQAQLAELSELAANPYAVLDGHAAYTRADGQGTFVTVWFRQARLHHFTEHFDATGTRGTEPSWVVQFALAPEEMGRESGAAGEFVMPAPREHAKPVAVKPDEVGEKITEPIPDSGKKFLPLTKAAYSIYSQELAPALQNLQRIFGQYGTIQGRAKNPDSAANRIQRAVQNGWAKRMDTVDDVLDNLWDAVGTRVVLNDSSPTTMSKLTDSLIQAVKNGDLTVNAINNLHGQVDGIPYFSAENIEKLEAEAELEVLNKPYDSGYTVVTIFVEDKKGVRGEIQLIGKETLKLANAEHLVYDAFLNKPYLPGFDPSKHDEVKKEVEPIRTAAQNLNSHQQEEYKNYLSAEYSNSRRKESGMLPMEADLPVGIPQVLSVSNLFEVDHNISSFKLKG